MTIKSPFNNIPRGRPKKDPQEILERLRVVLACGYPLQRACKLVGLNRKTVYNSIKTNTWLFKEIERYRNLPIEETLDFRSKIEFSSISYFDIYND